MDIENEDFTGDEEAWDPPFEGTALEVYQMFACDPLESLGLDAHAGPAAIRGAAAQHLPGLIEFGMDVAEDDLIAVLTYRVQERRHELKLPARLRAANGD